MKKIKVKDGDRVIIKNNYGNVHSTNIAKKINGKLKVFTLVVDYPF